MTELLWHAHPNQYKITTQPIGEKPHLYTSVTAAVATMSDTFIYEKDNFLSKAIRLGLRQKGYKALFKSNTERPAWRQWPGPGHPGALIHLGFAQWLHQSQWDPSGEHPYWLAAPLQSCSCGPR